MLSRKYNLGARYFYNKLNKDEKRLYRQMIDAFSKEIYVINHDLTWDRANMIEVFDAVINDSPELFYLGSSYLDWGEPFVLRVKGVNHYKHEEIVKIRKELDKIYHKFDHIKTPLNCRLRLPTLYARNIPIAINFVALKQRRKCTQ